jgi:hypothetical protein
VRLQLARPTFLAPHPTSPPHTPRTNTPHTVHISAPLAKGPRVQTAGFRGGVPLPTNATPSAPTSDGLGWIGFGWVGLGRATPWWWCFLGRGGALLTDACRGWCRVSSADFMKIVKEGCPRADRPGPRGGVQWGALITQCTVLDLRPWAYLFPPPPTLPSSSLLTLPQPPTPLPNTARFTFSTYSFSPPSFAASIFHTIVSLVFRFLLTSKENACNVIEHAAAHFLGMPGPIDGESLKFIASWSIEKNTKKQDELKALGGDACRFLHLKQFCPDELVDTCGFGEALPSLTIQQRRKLICSSKPKLHGMCLTHKKTCQLTTTDIHSAGTHCTMHSTMNNDRPGDEGEDMIYAFLWVALVKILKFKAVLHENVVTYGVKLFHDELGELYVIIRSTENVCHLGWATERHRQCVLLLLKVFALPIFRAENVTVQKFRFEATTKTLFQRKCGFHWKVHRNTSLPFSSPGSCDSYGRQQVEQVGNKN